MKRNHNLHIVKTKRSYSTADLADLFNVHIQTVRNWHKQGMQPIDHDDDYRLYLGSAVKEYLQTKRDSRKIKLKKSEYYCMGCQNKSTSLKTVVVPQNKIIGKGDQSVVLHGICIKCGTKLRKFDKLSDNLSVSEDNINLSLG